jgi:hypothetical protein
MLPPLMVQGSDGLWRLKDETYKLPLMFSLKTVKEAAGTDSPGAS